jgi:hypothetical protein
LKTGDSMTIQEKLKELYEKVARGDLFYNWNLSQNNTTLFIEKFVKIEDRDSPQLAIPFTLWDGQKKALDDFEKHRLNICLKARQLGFTWLALSKATHGLVFKQGYQVVALSRREDDAKELVRRVEFILRYLPKEMIAPGSVATDIPAWEATTTQITIHHPKGEPSVFKSLPAAADSGRSLTANLIILDEWAFQTYDREIWTAAYPTINRPTGGQVIGISTIKRGSLFEEIWEKSRDGRNTFNRIFMGWQTDPRRTTEWYEQTKKDIGDAVYAEYPSDEDEAFLTPGGNFFSEIRQHIHIVPIEPPHEWYKKFISIDYGLDALAALWYWVDAQGNTRIYRELYKSGLIVSEAAKAILRANNGDKIENFYAPPDLWNRNRDTGKSTAQIFYEHGIPLIRTSNSRISGWLNVKEYLHPYEATNEQTGNKYITAKLTINEGAAPNLWRCLQRIQKDENDPNDVATEPHELTHLPDSLRAFCVARKLPTTEPEGLKIYNFDFEKPQTSDGYFGGEVTEDYISGGY